MKSTILPLIFLLVQVAHAQMLPQKVEPSVSKSVVQRLITGLDGYVFPDKAYEMKEYLQQHMSSYETITDPQVLATRLTDDIRSVAHDKHLTVVYSDLAKEAEGTADPADKKKMHRIEEASGFGIRTVSRLPGNIGLLDMSYFSDDPEAAVALDGAMALLNGSDALIIDMRRNMGGNPIMVERLLTYLFSEQVQLTSVVWREGGKERTDEQWTLVYVPGPRMGGTPVFVLTSAKTFSAGEQLAYDLKTLNRATLIGETTGGGANPAAATLPLGAHFEAFIPNGRAVNPITKTNWEGFGVRPDVEVGAAGALIEAYKRALHGTHPSVTDSHLDRARQKAISDPTQALRDAGFSTESGWFASAPRASEAAASNQGSDTPQSQRSHAPVVTSH